MITQHAHGPKFIIIAPKLFNNRGATRKINDSVYSYND
jgi:hypothetical protein